MYCDKKVLQKYKNHSDYFISFNFIQTELCSINKIQHDDKKTLALSPGYLQHKWIRLYA